MTKGVYRVNSVGEQTAIFGKFRCPIDRRYVVSGRRRYDRRAMLNISDMTTRPPRGSRPRAMIAVSISTSL
jgi:hypothetical protein